MGKVSPPVTMHAFGGHGYAPLVINGCKVRVRAAAAGDAGALQSNQTPTKGLSFHNSFIINQQFANVSTFPTHHEP